MPTRIDSMVRFPAVVPQVVGFCEAFYHVPMLLPPTVKAIFYKMQEGYYRLRGNEERKFDVQIELTANQKVLSERVRNFIRTLLTFFIPFYGFKRYSDAKVQEDIKNTLVYEKEERFATRNQRREYLERAAKNGSFEAHFALYEIYFEKADYKNSLKHLQIAADGGYALAEAVYALRMEFEDLGLKANPKMTYDLYRRAALQGNPSAQRNFGNIYQSGKGVKQSYELANYWFKKAYDQDIHAAVYYIENMIDGDGVKKDIEKAYNMLKAIPVGRIQAELSSKCCVHVSKALHRIRDIVGNHFQDQSKQREVNEFFAQLNLESKR